MGIYTSPCKTKAFFFVNTTPAIFVADTKMALPMALSSEIFIDDILKKSLIFNEKDLAK